MQGVYVYLLPSSSPAFVGIPYWGLQPLSGIPYWGWYAAAQSDLRESGLKSLYKKPEKLAMTHITVPTKIPRV